MPLYFVAGFVTKKAIVVAETMEVTADAVHVVVVAAAAVMTTDRFETWLF